jgi:hypothetical protein
LSGFEVEGEKTDLGESWGGKIDFFLARLEWAK